MVAVEVFGLPRQAPSAVVRATLKVSFDSRLVSPTALMVIEAVVCPAGIVTEG